LPGGAFTQGISLADLLWSKKFPMILIESDSEEGSNDDPNNFSSRKNLSFGRTGSQNLGENWRGKNGSNVIGVRFL